METNKIYIGKTTETISQRRTRHLWNMGHGSKTYFHNSLRKYGPENFVWEIIDRCLFAESLLALEKYYIKKLNCMMPMGYNMTEGGEGGLVGRHISEAHKKKISLANTGRVKSEETRKRIKENHAHLLGKDSPRFGTHQTREAKDKISKTHKGKPWTDARRQAQKRRIL